ncbi:hypothetical protein [Cytobacillus sp. IB215316]|uniref:hypothetical protein n=1 Tax=Cytobacillus sp. IB215316 TaxID=3097354 RepID=UPI002A158F5B|nr:hypothetical protein [Cytobacillus sp. IB215316]MDX8361501.1 hypothetical protein [Cytobacillus sp. IB215316]
MKKFLSFMLVLVLILPSTAISASIEEWDTPIGGIKNTIQKGIDLGIVPERLQSQYANSITREEFAELLVNAIFIELQNTDYTLFWTKEMVLDKVTIDTPFSDTDLDHVKLAYIIGSVNGITETAFSPNNLVTRDQVVDMLMNTFSMENIKEDLTGAMKYSEAEGLEGYVNQLVDSSLSFVSGKHVFKEANESSFPFNGVIGEEDNSNSISREQAILIVMKLMDRTDYKTLQLRGAIDTNPIYDDLNYSIGKDYVNVTYVDNNYSTSEKLLEKYWTTFNITKDLKSGYIHEKALMLYPFKDDLLIEEFPWISSLILTGESSNIDYGHMLVDTFSKGHLLEFTLLSNLEQNNENEGTNNPVHVK